MPCASLYSCCSLRRREVSLIAACIESVILSAYIITWPSLLRAALPTVWIREVSERKNPSLSASKIATSVISGISSPSRSRLMPTSTSNTSRRRSLKISARSSVSISECRYLTRMPTSCIYAVRSSAIRLVSVVISTLFFFAVSLFTSEIRSSICPCTGRTSIFGSNSPVGRIICSTRSSSCSFS